MNKILFMLRHAAHEEGGTGRFFGRTDFGLSDAGKRQAAGLASVLSSLKPEVCLCSPLRRCVETLGPDPGFAVDFHPDLREIDFGSWEGRTFAEMQMLDAVAVGRWAEYDPDFAFPGGESLKDFNFRIQRVADAILNSPARAILVATHAGVIRALICRFLGLHPRCYLLFHVHPASLTVLDILGNRGILRGLNCREWEGDA